MENLEKYQGYDPKFLGQKLIVSYPRLSDKISSDIGHSINGEKYLDYIHYSLLMSKKRRFPYYTATNIDGTLFKKITRKSLFGGSDKWSIDNRAGAHQWGQKLYDAPNSPFHRGHMTKREDPQWGMDDSEAADAARATFYFTNSIPQIAELNSKDWSSLERYILSRQAIKYNLKINLFTGPVLADNDPLFVSEVQGQRVQFPMLFWKVIFYSVDGEKLSCVAFLMGQQKAMFKAGIVEPMPIARGAKSSEEPYFTDYKDAKTYQVSVKFIESLTGLNFKNAREPFRDERPRELILEEVEVNPRSPVNAKAERLLSRKYEYKGIQL